VVLEVILWLMAVGVESRGKVGFDWSLKMGFFI
jgi:hypothetical protein